MVEERLPRLTEARVRELASEKSFERGQTYYRDGGVLEPVHQEMVLRAQCEGSDYEPYQVSATLAEDGIAETSCMCPYDYGGICKHVVALPLTYVQEPKTFRFIPSLATLLAGAIYHAVLDEAVRGYDDMLREIDGDGGIAVVIDEFALGLSQCLKKSKADAETRRAWLEALLEAELTDIEMGGIDLAPSAREAV